MQKHIMKALKKFTVLAAIVSASQFLLNYPVFAQQACVVTSAGQKVCGTLIPDDSKSQASVAIVGKWQSDWGSVFFKPDLTGYWYQGSATKVGQIKKWTYDPKTRKLVFHYYQSWNQMNGTATLTLLEDGKRLAGSWTQQSEFGAPGSGGSGSWTLTRDPS
jgi:hypothetical protein